jgi:hypothetical protein
MTCAPESCAGRFIPFRIPASWARYLAEGCVEDQRSREQLGRDDGRYRSEVIVYVPTGSAAFDFYGADRVGDDLFANCLIALNAETGERIWHFQGVRHDLWDRDFPAPPVLLTVERDGKKVDAVAQTTKQGFVFLFDRTNGSRCFPSSAGIIRRAMCQEKWPRNSNACR